MNLKEAHDILQEVLVFEFLLSGRPKEVLEHLASMLPQIEELATYTKAVIEDEIVGRGGELYSDEEAAYVTACQLLDEPIMLGRDEGFDPDPVNEG